MISCVNYHLGQLTGMLKSRILTKAAKLLQFRETPRLYNLATRETPALQLHVKKVCNRVIPLLKLLI